MKSEIINCNNNQKIYPYIGCNKNDSNKIVLFIALNTGTLLVKGNHFEEIGNISVNWREHDYYKLENATIKFTV